MLSLVSAALMNAGILLLPEGKVLDSMVHSKQERRKQDTEGSSWIDEKGQIVHDGIMPIASTVHRDELKVGGNQLVPFPHPFIIFSHHIYQVFSDVCSI